MRALTAFFAGAGTVVAAVAAGLGGGLLIADSMNPKTPAQQATRLERHTTPSPSPSPSPSLAAAQPTASQLAPAPSSSPSADPAKRDTQDQASAPDAAFAKARDADLKTRDTDLKQTSRRHRGRHRQWAEQHRMQRAPEADPRDVEQPVREDQDPRGYVVARPVEMELPRIHLFDGF